MAFFITALYAYWKNVENIIQSFSNNDAIIYVILKMMHPYSHSRWGITSFMLILSFWWLRT
jgi:hypothetical protein